MNLNPNYTVRSLALEIPGATRVFEKAGIDYCCGGERSLAHACATAGIAIEEVVSLLELANNTQATNQGRDFQTETLAKLIDHIVDTHHVFTKTEIQRLGALMQKVCDVHVKNHPELDRLHSLFQTLCAELEPHMMKEERVLFPFMIGMEAAVTNNLSFPRPPFGTVANPVRMMMREHDGAGELLRQMRELTSNYTLPEDACISYHTLYEALDAFEKDLHQHIHLENNILFPRAVEMENQSLGKVTCSKVVDFL